MAHSTYRGSNRHRRPSPPPFIADPPSPEYLALAQTPSTHLSPNDVTSLPRQLLVLDLNGTLLLRSPRAYGAQRMVMARPYAKTFREYLFRENSHLDVMVWSSAQPHSVASMLDVLFGSDRDRLAAIWARDTLGLPEASYSLKVQTVKNLEIIWNAPAGLPPPIKIMPPPPMAILTDDPTTLPGYDPYKPPQKPKNMLYNSAQLVPKPIKSRGESEEDRSTYWVVPNILPDDPIPGLGGVGSSSAGDTSSVEAPELYSALNTLLLDDSPLKAHLQPYNHLTLPEYTVELRARDVRRREAIDTMLRDGENGQAEGDADDTLEGGDVARSPLSAGSNPPARLNYRALRSAPFDKTLIAVIGVLSAIRYESSIVGWMRAGGMRPSAEEMARLATLADQELNNHNASQPSVEEADETPLDDGSGLSTNPTKRLLSKRLSSPMPIDQQRSPKRNCAETGTAGSPEDLMALDEVVSAREAGNVTSGARQMSTTADRILAVKGNRSLRKTDTTGVSPAAVQYGSLPIFSSTPSEDPVSPDITIGDLQNPTQNTLTKRKRIRNRQKPRFPVTHPLGASDFYQFFLDGTPGDKLWFQDREVYTYWVRRGILELRECGIEPEDGVEAVGRSGEET